jgi:hypothetical protein
MPALRQILQAAAELGLGQLALYGIYRLGLKSGHYKRLTPAGEQSSAPVKPAWEINTHILPLPEAHKLRQITNLDALYAEADEIVSGEVRLFGGEPVTLVLTHSGPLMHWSETPEEAEDIKPVWEAARFGWAIILARAYHASGVEDYAQAFWRHTEEFLRANPANMGAHWASAQEVALRLIALVFAIQVFAGSEHSTPERMAVLAQALAEHAQRIPPTLVYARAQNNNHLISEAAGLYTAAAALPTHPEAKRWKKLGWKWLNAAFQSQIDVDGTYIQQSSNYHRLMLQAALWVFNIQRNAFPDEVFPKASTARLEAAARWLFELMDPVSGGVPNLGPNDGAYILPLSTCPFSDYRPVVQAAGAAFMQKRLVEAGAWDEMTAWFGLDDVPALTKEPGQNEIPQGSSAHTLQHQDAWAYLRAVQLHARPGHADQLHLDLWWRGLNIAQDAGTYLYNAANPWDNALTHTAVHNTIMVDGIEQMRRAGRFLYLEWAQAENPKYEQAQDGSWQRLSAQHNGYRRLGIVHKRVVTVDQQGEWVISDLVSGASGQKTHQARIQWLLPDWEYRIESEQEDFKTTIFLTSPWSTQISLILRWMDAPGQTASQAFQWGLARGGQLAAGTGLVQPTWGWTSPTYGYKMPALAFYVTVSARLPIHIQSQWGFP